MRSPATFAVRNGLLAPLKAFCFEHYPWEFEMGGPVASVMEPFPGSEVGDLREEGAIAGLGSKPALGAFLRRGAERAVGADEEVPMMWVRSDLARRRLVQPAEEPRR